MNTKRKLWASLWLCLLLIVGGLPVQRGAGALLPPPSAIPARGQSGLDRMPSYTLVASDRLMRATTVSPTVVSILGPAAGRVGSPYTFTAYVEPMSTTLPLTYTWQATDGLVITHTGELSDTVVFTWLTPGAKTVNVEVSNEDGSQSNMIGISIAPLEVALHKSVSPEQAPAEGILAYTIVYTNMGEIVLPTAILTDAIPNHTTFLDAQEGGVFSAGEVQWTLENVSAYGAGAVHFRVQVYSDTLPGAAIVNTAYFTSPQSLLQVSNPATSTVQVQPNFSLSTKSATGGSVVQPGDMLTYTIAYQNSGTETAVGVIISDTLPPYVTYHSGGQYANGVVVFDVGTVEIDQVGSVDCVVQVKEDVVGGTVITNVAVIDSAQTDPIFTNIVAQTVNGPHLLVSKAVTPTGMVTPTAFLTYTLTYTNDGNLEATDVVISDVLPAGLLYLNGGDEWDGTTVRWNGGNLGVGESGQVAFTAQVLEGVGRIDNWAYAKASQAQLGISNRVTTSVDAPALLVVKSANPVAEVFQGAVLTYTLFYTNTGTMTVHNTLLVDSLNPDVTFINGGTYITASHAVSFVLGTVAPGYAGQVVFTVQVNAAVNSNITNTAQIFYDEYYPYAQADALDLSDIQQFSPYGGSSGREYVAQSFIATAPRLQRAGISVYGHVSPYPEIGILVLADDNGEPDLAQVLAAGAAYSLTSLGQRYFVEPVSSVRLQIGARYWVVVRFTTSGSGSAGVQYAQGTYSAGQWLYSDDAGATWKPPLGLADADLNMRVEYVTPPLSNKVVHKVLESARCLMVSPQALHFYAVKDSTSPGTKTITVGNCALGKVNWTASENSNWLSIAPTAGQAPSTIVVSATQAGLDFGTYTATITIDGGDAQNSPQIFPVTLEVITGKIYLPITLRNWPPEPPTLTLGTPDQNGNYTASWSNTGADFYTLQEATDGAFTGATQVYSGTNTSFNVVGRGPTRYYYRVRGVHGDYITGWSPGKSVDVVWEKEPNNDLNNANGPLISGILYHGYFNSPSDYFKIRVTQAGTASVTLTGGSEKDSIALRDINGKIINDGKCYKYLKDNIPLTCAVSQSGQYYIQVYTSVTRTVEYALTVAYP